MRDVCDSIILSGLENIVVHFHIINIDHAAAALYSSIKEQYALSFSLSTESTVVYDKAYPDYPKGSAGEPLAPE